MLSGLGTTIVDCSRTAATLLFYRSSKNLANEIFRSMCSRYAKENNFSVDSVLLPRPPRFPPRFDQLDLITNLTRTLHSHFNFKDFNEIPTVYQRAIIDMLVDNLYSAITKMKNDRGNATQSEQCGIRSYQQYNMNYLVFPKDCMDEKALQLTMVPILRHINASINGCKICLIFQRLQIQKDKYAHTLFSRLPPESVLELRKFLYQSAKTENVIDSYRTAK